MLVEPSTFKFLYQPEEGQAQVVEQVQDVEQEQEFAQEVEEQEEEGNENSWSIKQ